MFNSCCNRPVMIFEGSSTFHVPWTHVSLQINKEVNIKRFRRFWSSSQKKTKEKTNTDSLKTQHQGHQQGRTGANGASSAELHINGAAQRSSSVPIITNGVHGPTQTPPRPPAGVSGLLWLPQGSRRLRLASMMNASLPHRDHQMERGKVASDGALACENYHWLCLYCLVKRESIVSLHSQHIAITLAFYTLHIS